MIVLEKKAPCRGSGEGAGAIPTANNDASVPHRTSAAQRLPAFGRRLKAALDAGLRPRAGGGAVIVTSDWSYAQAFDPGRVICPPVEPADSFDFGFLRGLEVVVVVPERDQVHGERLVARICDAGARLVVLAVDREDEP